MTLDKAAKSVKKENRLIFEPDMKEAKGELLNFFNNKKEETLETVYIGKTHPFL